MTLRIFKDVGFSRFARCQNISDSGLCAAVERAERGLVDADLGGGVIKQRIPRLNEGRSSGFRTIIFFRVGERAFFVFGFAKNDAGNISADDLKIWLYGVLCGQMLKLLIGDTIQTIRSAWKSEESRRFPLWSRLRHPIS